MALYDLADSMTPLPIQLVLDSSFFLLSARGTTIQRPQRRMALSGVLASRLPTAKP